MPDVSVSVADSADRPALENLMQLYIHDFSEHWSGTSRGELGNDGRFPEYELGAYWRQSDHIPLLVSVDRRLAGFALLNVSSHSDLPVDRNMAEFFVVRKHRRSGVGTVAVHTIFDRYSGMWEAAVARRNVGALPFWRSAVGRYPLVEDVQELDLATEKWNGPVLRFRIRDPEGRCG